MVIIDNLSTSICSLKVKEQKDFITRLVLVSIVFFLDLPNYFKLQLSIKYVCFLRRYKKFIIIIMKKKIDILYFFYIIFE